MFGLLGDLAKTVVDVASIPVDVAHGVAKSVGMDELTEPFKELSKDLAGKAKEVCDNIEDSFFED